ncbi:MAG: right-handed parallel beta-helix repeat-containing protein [Candidatus Saccharimonadales bacterium]|jgi:LysM repeat protein
MRLRLLSVAKKQTHKIPNKILLTIGVISSFAFASLALSSHAYAATVTVCASSCNQTTISAAVAAASPGDTITVAPGTYSEVVSISKNLTLLGAQAGVAGSSHSGAESTVTAFNVTSANVTLDGFTINPGTSNSGVGIQFSGGTSETIQNNIITGYGSEGMGFFGTSGMLFQRNLLTSPLPSALDGIFAGGGVSNNTQVLNNVFNAASIYPGTDIGLSYTSGSSPIISGNVSTNGATLVTVFNSTGAQITNNVFNGDPNLSASIVYIGGGDTNTTISGNTVSGGYFGVALRNNYGDGVNVSTTITGNSLTNNYGGGISVASGSIGSSEIVTAHQNDLSGNPVGVSNSSAGTVNATNNYWGTAVTNTITSSLITGSGVTYTPYYVDSGLTTLSNVAPSTVFVGGTYVDGAAGGHIFGYDAFTTIQAGVSAVADGGTVNVAAGIYHESQIVLFGSNKGLTLQGAGASVTTIDGGNAVVSGSGTHPGTIYIKNPDTPVKIDGFTFINPVNNTSIGEIASIVIAFGSNPPTPSSITISNNHFIGVANNGSNPFDNAIWVYATPAGTVTNITNNEFDHQWQSILLEQPQGGAVITGNNFHDLFANVDSGTTYVPEGIFLMSYGGENVSAPVAINNNFLSSFNGQSIALSGGYPGSGMAQYTNVQVENNQITADGFGIYFRNTGTTPALAAQGGIQGATISGNIITSITPGTGTGIWLRGPNNNATITNNSITGYANGILSEEYNPGAGTSTGVSVHETSLAGNTIAVSNQGSPTIDATNNWWGSTDPNFASIIQGSAAYTAWCSDATCTSLLSDSAVSLSASNGVATTSSTGPMTLTGSTSSGDATATIPAGTTITDSTGLWDGTLNPPVVSSYSVPGLSGYTTTTLLAISIGSNSYTLTFDRGVKLLLPGQAGQRVGFIEPGGSFTEITTTCSGDNQTVGDALPAGGACKINDGSGNLIIWTKHFTIFATYSQTANSTSAVTTISTPAAAKTTTYVIQPGDTMSGIASKFGLTLAQLENLNPQAGHPAGNFDLILPGDVLKVGGATASVASATTTVTTAPAATPTQPQQVLGSSTSTTAPLQTKPASKKTPAVASVSSNKLLGLKWWWWLIILAAVLAASVSGSYIYKIAETDKHK